MLNGVVLRLHHPDGQVFRFEPGSLAFAFSVTGAPIDPDRFETLREPADLARWAFEILGATEVRATPSSVRDARRLRAAIWGATDALIDEGGLRDRDRETLNAFAASPGLVPRLDPDGTRSWAPGSSAAALLSTIARDAIEVTAGPLASRVRRCEGVNCAIPFVDTSRPGTRRWCSMERCGNRAKAAAHRRRHRREVPA